MEAHQGESMDFASGESFADQATGLQVDLPLGLRIYRSAPARWVGASDSDRYFLYIERNASNRLSSLPAIMMDQEIELFVSGLNRKQEQIIRGVRGRKVEGTLFDRPVCGYLAGVTVRGTTFLVLVLHRENGSPRMARSFALMTVENILLAAADEVVF